MAIEPIERQPLWQPPPGPEKENWATPRVSWQYWRVYRSRGKVSPIEVALWVVGLLAFELPQPKVEMQIMGLGGAVLLRLLIIPIRHLIQWRCPSCHRLFTRRHKVGRCEHCGIIFPK